MKSFSLKLLTLALVSAGFIASSSVQAAPCAAPSTVLKLATVAPEGTTLYKGLMNVKTAINTQTEGCVDIQIFAGSVQGDEKDVIRKIRIGQLDIAALTGVGLGDIVPEVRVLELPFLFKTEAQVNSVYAAMRPYFDKAYEAKGFKLMGWAGIGFIQIFSNKSITKKADMNGVKMWMWEGDPLAQAMYESLKVVPVPLALPDVLSSLTTGLIDGAYGPGLGAIALQWHTKVKYMTKVDLSYGSGGLVISNAAWAKLNPSQQTIVKNVIDQEAAKLTTQTNIDSAQSEQILQASGIQIVQLDPASKTELEGISKEVQAKLVGKLYSQELLNQVLALIK
ncbi:TRAP transporter substrate-binding protein DctP [bacterium]|nr:TRAP transporter substrate-binding protein DctP [bacterium]